MRYGETRRQAYRRGVLDGIGYSVLALCVLAVGFTVGVMV